MMFKHIIICYILLFFSFMVLQTDKVEAKMNTQKTVTVSSYKRCKNGVHKHSTYKTKKNCNATKKGK